MAKRLDPFDLMNEAGDEARDVLLEVLKDARKDITRPLIGRKLPKQERLTNQRAFVSDPAAIGSEFDRMAAQYKTKPGMMPRRLFDNYARAVRDLRKER